MKIIVLAAVALAFVLVFFMLRRVQRRDEKLRRHLVGRVPSVTVREPDA